MSETEATDNVGPLLFVLSQLRDDLDEIVDGLTSRRRSYELSKQGAVAQFQWALKELEA